MRVLGQGEHFCAKRVFDSNADVIYGWSRVSVKLLIDPDGVGEFDRVQGTCVRAYGIWDLGKVHLLPTEDL